MSGIKGIKKVSYEETHKTDERGELFKKCNKHDLYFPEEDAWIPCTEEYFYKNKSSGRDGLNTWCKRCSVRKSVQWGKDHPLKRHEYLEVENRKEIRKMDRRKSSAKRRESGELRNWQRNNTDKLKQYAENRNQNKTHTISKKEWQKCLDYFNNSCAYCGISNEDAKEQYKNYLHKEHVDHNGANDLSNCVPACKSCNSEKRTFILEEWYNENNIKFNENRFSKIHKWLEEDYKLYIKEIIQNIKGVNTIIHIGFITPIMVE